jgi:hypothetical protein
VLTKLWYLGLLTRNIIWVSVFGRKKDYNKFDKREVVKIDSTEIAKGPIHEIDFYSEVVVMVLA